MKVDSTVIDLSSSSLKKGVTLEWVHQLKLHPLIFENINFLFSILMTSECGFHLRINKALSCSKLSFQDILTNAKSVTTTEPSCLMFTIFESF